MNRFTLVGLCENVRSGVSRISARGVLKVRPDTKKRGPGGGGGGCCRFWSDTTGGAGAYCWRGVLRS